MNDYKFDGDYLLIAEDGTVTINGCNPMLQNVSGKFWVSNHAHVLQCEDPEDQKFLYYQLSNTDISPFVTGAVQPKLSQANLNSIPILWPKKKETRQKIAEVLGTLDEKIELNRKMNKSLESLARAIFNNACGSEDEMEEKPLGDVFDFLEGPGIRNWQYSDKGTRFINIRLISNGNIDIKSANFINQEDVEKKYQHFLLRENDLVVSTSGTLGRNAIVRKSHLPLLLNTSVIRFRPKANTGYPFMYQYFNSDLFLSMQSAMASGSAQVNFGPMHLKQIKVVMPRRQVLGKLNEMLRPVYEQFINNMNQIDTLSEIRDSILPRLMSGKLRVR